MKKVRVLTIICFALTAFAFSSCRNNSSENQNVSSLTSHTPKEFSKIEEVDFENFTYPYPDQKIGEPLTRYFTLTNGEKPYGKVEDISFKLSKVDYADLTNDGKNEALIHIAVGLAVSKTNWIYVYALNADVNQHLGWMQIFSTGELEKGGLRNVYAENGDLVIELFGKNKFENDEWKFDPCCPKTYTQTFFKWVENKFVVQKNTLNKVSTN